MVTITLVAWAFITEVTRCSALEGMLYPRESETREVITLNGIWNFVVSPMNDSTFGIRNHWYKKDISQFDNMDNYLMPVPSSYNDITQNRELRDHVGVVWYQRTFFVPKSWANRRVCLRFSSVLYAANVWVNGKLVMKHDIGHLPFQSVVTAVLKFGKSNKVTVSCNNALSISTIPQGDIKEMLTDKRKTLIQEYHFDFYHYAGIDRPVTLYTTPHSYIDDITVHTDIDGTTGIVHYIIKFIKLEKTTCVVTLLNKSGNNVAKQEGNGKGMIKVHSAKLWWPYLMHSKPGYLYTLQVELWSTSGHLLDVYRQPIGIRKISWTNKKLVLNNRQLYLHGFGRHEDSDIRGKGLDLPTVVKDHNLIKWVGGNAYRTSHYPYAEEIMDLADQLGIMIIDECPAVSLHGYSNKLLKNHQSSLTQLIRRDKNRPSVIMWSVANEPMFLGKASDQYFGKVIAKVKSLDNTRPVTMSVATKDTVIQHADIISFNKYSGWYEYTGELDMITDSVIKEVTSLHVEFNKPVLISEYGADTIEGLHIHPEYVWSEEYQVSLMSKHFKAFDKLRSEGWFVGEFIWNFADFRTAQRITRVGGNKKGIFTRNRQPKSSAHLLRKRYFLLAKELYNVALPEDLLEYIAPVSKIRDEL